MKWEARQIKPHPTPHKNNFLPPELFPKLPKQSSEPKKVRNIRLPDSPSPQELLSSKAAAADLLRYLTESSRSRTRHDSPNNPSFKIPVLIKRKRRKKKRKRERGGDGTKNGSHGRRKNANTQAKGEEVMPRRTGRFFCPLKKIHTGDGSRSCSIHVARSRLHVALPQFNPHLWL